MKLADHSIPDLKDFLDEKASLYNSVRFIEDDPIAVPHEFSRKEDREISAFFAATIAWGNRKSILRNAREIVRRMDNSPHEFILHHTSSERLVARGFVHRTFNEEDLMYFFEALQHIYRTYGSLENAFGAVKKESNCADAIGQFRQRFFELPHAHRTRKHVSDPLTGSASKRLNMFLRWMVRKDTSGVDFGIWKSISPGALSIPLDVHSGNVARALGLLHRKQNDWKAVEELDAVLRSFDPVDPVRYDFALFGLGAIEKFTKALM